MFRLFKVIPLLLTFICSQCISQSLNDALSNKDTVRAAQIIQKGYNFDSLNAFGNSVLMNACRYTDDTVAAAFLLRHGAPPDYPRSKEGRTPLIIACAYYGGVPLCRLLLRYGADINATNNKGVTPLMMAASNAKTELVAYLLQMGANQGIKDNNGNTALDYARQASIDDDLKKMIKCCTLDKEKTIEILSQTVK